MALQDNPVARTFIAQRTKVRISQQKLGRLIDKLRTKIFMFQRGTFPRNDFINVLKVLIYLRLNLDPGSSLVDRGHAALRQIGCPKYLDHYLHLLPKDYIIRLSNENNIIIDCGFAVTCRLLIQNQSFANSLDAIYAWMDLNGKVHSHWIKQYTVTNKQLPFTIQTYQTTYVDLNTGLKSPYLFLPSYQIQNNYSMCFGLFFFAVIRRNQFQNYNIINNIKHYLTIYTQSDFNQSIDENLDWFWDGHNEPKIVTPPVTISPRPQLPPSGNKQQPVHEAVLPAKNELAKLVVQSFSFDDLLSDKFKEFISLLKDNFNNTVVIQLSLQPT